MRTAVILCLGLFLHGCRSSPSIDLSGLTISELNDKLIDPDPNVRWAAVFELGSRDKQAAPAIPNLIKCLKDKNVAVRQVTTQTLGRILVSLDPPYDNDVQNAIAALRRAQSDPDETVRTGARIALSGVDAKSGR